LLTGNRESFIQQYFPKMMAKAAGWMAASSAVSAAAAAPPAAAALGAGAARTGTPELPPPYSF
jgi:hypothetical protein